MSNQQCPIQGKYNTKTQKQKFIIALVKQHSSSDMRTIKNHSITSNTKLIQNYQTNIGISN